MKPSRVVLYVRVSTEEQSVEGVSLADQERRLRAYAEACELRVVAVEVDAGVSAKSLDRPGLRRALEALRAKRADGLVVAKLDRLTRSVRDLSVLLDDYFSGEKWSLLSLGEQIDTRTPAGRLMLNLLASVAQWEREVIGSRTSAAMQHKKACGERVGSVPVGLRVVAGSKRLVVDEREQEGIEVARRMRRDGKPLRAIQAALLERGVTGRRGQTLSLTTIARMTNEHRAA